MHNRGTLRLKLVDIYGSPINDKVDIYFYHQVLSDRRIVKNAPGGKRLEIPELLARPQGVYRIQINSARYLPAGLFVNIKSEGFTDLDVTLPFNRDKIARVDFPIYSELAQDLRTLLESSDAVFGFAGRSGAALYDSLDDVRKGGLLNIATKARVTPLIDETMVLPQIQSLLEFREDRIFAVVSDRLREDTKNSVSAGLFDSVSSVLHDPEEGFRNVGSYKTPDRYGNLQLTFSVKGGETRIDADIDDLNGLAHVFQVVRNSLMRRSTHPYDIHQILMVHQGLDSGYRLIVQ